jgi:hypothetical protein
MTSKLIATISRLRKLNRTAKNYEKGLFESQPDSQAFAIFNNYFNPKNVLSGSSQMQTVLSNEQEAMICPYSGAAQPTRQMDPW